MLVPYSQMNDSKVAYISRLFSELSFDINYEFTSENFTCSICKKIMIDAYKSVCGCQYCRGCIDKYLRDGNNYCPGAKFECKKEYVELDKDVVRNNEINGKIYEMNVYCRNKSCGCTLPLFKMEEHMRLCNRVSLICPYANIGCDKQNSSQQTLLTHLYDELLGHTKLLIEWINNSKNEINGLKSMIELNAIEISKLKEESKFKDVQTLEIIEEMRCLKEESNRKQIELTSALKEISILKRDVSYVREDTNYIKNVMATVEKETESITFIPNIELDRSVTKKADDTRIKDRSRAPMDKLRTTLDKLRSKSNANATTGVMMITVDKFSTRKINEEIVSPLFYSHSNGYKFRLLIYPRDNSINIPCLWVSFALCKGEYDNLLQWPCRYSINISIINQLSGKTHNSVTYKYSSISDSNKYIFNKPDEKDTIAGMYDTLISHEDLLSVTGVIVNDSVLLKCVLSPPT